MKKIILFVFFIAAVKLQAQDTIFARHIVDTLTSSTFSGRGYTNDGLFRAMQFLQKQFTDIGLKPMNGKSFLQPLSYSVNTFPGEMSVKINGKELRPGYDFIVSKESKGLSGEFQLERRDSNTFFSREKKLVIKIEEKLTWSVSTKVSDSTTVIILKGVLADDPKKIDLKIENRLVDNYKTGNVCGFVKGKKKSDSLIVFTAHYDHLGGMGRSVYFPGANDNASGISLLLGMAKWYAKNPQSYSIAFICFTGEEAGLLGSAYFVRHPLVELKSIRFLINLDLTGTGDEGITVVNATKHVKEFELMNAINDEQDFLAAINSRGKAKNSDHYWFSEKGVPSFFIYTLGGIKAYHDVYDISSTLPMNEYSDLFKLLKEFVTRVVAK